MIAALSKDAAKTVPRSAMPISSEISERIAQYKWYQRIPITDDYVTPGEDTFTAEKLPLLQLPARLDGCSVLDIGCSEGFFARAAEQRGATRIMGIDSAPHLAEKNALLAEITGSQLEFHNKTIYDLSRETFGEFDLVIFLSVFQHLDHPFQALSLISSLTRTTAVMEVPIAVSKENDPEFQQEPISITRRSPKDRRIFLPNEAMLTEMLSDAGFASVERLIRHRPRDVPGYDKQFRQERLILHAHKGAARL